MLVDGTKLADGSVEGSRRLADGMRLADGGAVGTPLVEGMRLTDGYVVGHLVVGSNDEGMLDCINMVGLRAIGPKDGKNNSFESFGKWVGGAMSIFETTSSATVADVLRPTMLSRTSSSMTSKLVTSSSANCPVDAYTSRLPPALKVENVIAQSMLTAHPIAAGIMCDELEMAKREGNGKVIRARDTGDVGRVGDVEVGVGSATDHKGPRAQISAVAFANGLRMRPQPFSACLRRHRALFGFQIEQLPARLIPKLVRHHFYRERGARRVCVPRKDYLTADILFGQI